MDYELMLQQAIQTINSELEPGKTFEVKLLYPGHVWDGLTRGQKSAMGRYFSDAFKDGRIPGIVRLERGRDNHSRYQKMPL